MRLTVAPVERGRVRARALPAPSILGEASEGAVEAPADDMGEHVVMIYGKDRP
jgi:hypothetical protein